MWAYLALFTISYLFLAILKPSSVSNMQDKPSLTAPRVCVFHLSLLEFSELRQTVSTVYLLVQ